jgi:hypothetical protein
MRKGYLEKKKGRVFKAYSKVLVKLDGKTLSYFDNEDKLKGVINFDLYKVTVD